MARSSGTCFQVGDADKVGEALALHGRPFAARGPCIVVLRDDGVTVGEVKRDGEEKDAENEVVNARVLPIVRLPGGRRHRSFREGVAVLTESEWSGWPLSGPRTLLWCLRFICDHDEHPTARHVKWRSVASITEKDDGADTHETAMRYLDHLMR